MMATRSSCHGAILEIMAQRLRRHVTTANKVANSETTSASRTNCSLAKSIVTSLQVGDRTSDTLSRRGGRIGSGGHGKNRHIRVQTPNCQIVRFASRQRGDDQIGTSCILV